MGEAACANCAGSDDVRHVTPDMDIAPVPLCTLCRWWLTSDPDEFNRRGSPRV